MPTRRRYLRSVEDLVVNKSYAVFYKIPNVVTGKGGPPESDCGHFTGVFTGFARIPVIKAKGEKRKHQNHCRMVACFKAVDPIDIAYMVEVTEVR